MSDGDGQAPQKEPRYWTGAHTTHRLRYHLVFVPKYRRRVLEGPVASRLRELIGQACEVNGWEVRELAVRPDHVHLLAQVQPRYSVPAVAKLLKIKPSRAARAGCCARSSRTWRSSCGGRASGRWGTPNLYFAVSVGTVEGEAVARYIREQRQL